MAEAKCLMSGELQQLLQCSICYNTFTNPLCLPCMHTFCCNCIKDYVHKLQKDRRKAKEFNCPTCRCRVAIPKGGVDQLPKHLFVENLKDVIASTTKPEINCDYCFAIGTETLATWRCIDCSHSICDPCKQAHDIAHRLSKKMHTLMKINKWKNSDVSTLCNQSKEPCPRHAEESLTFYCSRCEVAICQSCQRLDHLHHTCKDLATVAEETKGSIQNSIKSIATLIKEREDAIKELTRCSDVITSSRDKVITHIREQKALFLISVSQCFDDIEKNANGISNESQKKISVNINSIMSDISSLKVSNQIAHDVSHYGRKAEIIESTKRLLKVIKSQKDSAIDLHRIKSSLHTIKYEVNKIELRDLCGVCEKTALFPDLRNDMGADALVCGPQEQKVMPSLGKILKQSELKTRFNTELPIRSVTTLQNGNERYDIIAGHNDCVSVYNQEGKKRHDFSRPPGIRKWSPYYVNAYNNGKQTVVIVTNSALLKDGGGVYEYEADGRFTNRRIIVNAPLNAAALDDRRVAVLMDNTVKSCGCVDIYDIETGYVVSSTRNTAKLCNSKHISVSPVTQEVIVTHREGVTALSPVDLTPRWQYNTRQSGAGELIEPLALCVDLAGRVLVSDCVTRRVLVLSTDGEYITTLYTDGFINSKVNALTVTRQGQLVGCGKGQVAKRSIFIAEYMEK